MNNEFRLIAVVRATTGGCRLLRVLRMRAIATTTATLTITGLPMRMGCVRFLGTYKAKSCTHYTKKGAVNLSLKSEELMGGCCRIRPVQLPTAHTLNFTGNKQCKL